MKKPVVTPAVLWIRAEFLLAPTSHYVFITKLGILYSIFTIISVRNLQKIVNGT